MTEPTTDSDHGLATMKELKSLCPFLWDYWWSMRALVLQRLRMLNSIVKIEEEIISMPVLLPNTIISVVNDVPNLFPISFTFFFFSFTFCTLCHDQGGRPITLCQCYPVLWPCLCWLPSAARICLGFPVCQLHPGVTTLRLHLETPRPSLHLSLSTSQLLAPLAPPWTVVLAAASGFLIPPSLVNHRSAFATDFRALGCAPSLHPFGPVGLLLPSCSTSMLSCTSVLCV